MGLKSVRTYPYLHPDIRAVIVVSDHNRDYLSFAYPEVKIYRVYNGIDPEKFRYRPIEAKKTIISCLPSKNPVDLSQAYHILMSRAHQGVNNIGNYDWAFIENMPEQEVARVLGDSLIFVFLSTEEGFGKMPLEAMLSGGLVAAYNGGPLLEYLNRENSFLSPKGDVLDVVMNIEKITEVFNRENNFLNQVSQNALNAASRYSLEREEESVLKTWEEIIESD
jgi:glycosyltransferase involved in cell wall biosynthesis